jgi:signal transduction histidine kinase
MANIDQQIAITSIPDGADVKIGNMSGTTPMTVTVPGGYGIPQSFQIFKEGYQPQTTRSSAASGRGLSSKTFSLGFCSALSLSSPMPSPGIGGS